MRIIQIKVYQVDIPVQEPVILSQGKRVDIFDTTVVEIITDSGIKGYGEICPYGPSYVPSYASGVRAGIKELAPKLIGLDPLEITYLNEMMDFHLKGHPYVKSPIDMACWDILGKHSNLPLYKLFGGKFGDRFPVYESIMVNSPEKVIEKVKQYKQQGLKHYQLKLGGSLWDDVDLCRQVRKLLDPSDMLVGDANTGWLSHQAITACEALKDVDIYIEQPCASYEECLRVQRHTSKPLILDESIDCVEAILRAYVDNSVHIVSLKISKFGGITKTKLARDLCVSLGIAMTINDTWGSEIVSSAIAHIAQSTPGKYGFTTSNFTNSVCMASGGPETVDGMMKAPEGPGLGVVPLLDVLGRPVYVCGMDKGKNGYWK